MHNYCLSLLKRVTTHVLLRPDGVSAQSTDKTTLQIKADTKPARFDPRAEHRQDQREHPHLQLTNGQPWLTAPPSYGMNWNTCYIIDIPYSAPIDKSLGYALLAYFQLQLVPSRYPFFVTYNPNFRGLKRDQALFSLMQG